MSAPSLAASLPEPILVLGAYGYRNVGDEAILAGLLDAVGRDRRVSVVSRSPAETEAMHRVPGVPLRRALAELSRHRSLLIGGGGLFGADLGWIGRLLPYYGLLAASSGREVAIHGIGLDQDLSGLAGHLVPRLAARCVELSVRDQASAARLGVDLDRVTVAPDLSSRVKPAPTSRAHALLRAAGLDPNRPVIGLCLTAVNPSLVEPVMRAVSEAMERLPDVQFCFLPMSQHPFVRSHNDLILGRAMQRSQPRLAIGDGIYASADVLALIGAWSAVVAMRYHSFLFAERAEVPIVAIPYAPKCRTWLGERGIDPVGLAEGELAGRLQELLAQQVAA